MEEEEAPKKAHTLGDDLSRLSVRELEALRQACLDEAERISAEMKAKDATRAAAESVFKL